jgi:hypothetical protein
MKGLTKDVTFHCKVRGASIRCGLEVGDGEAVLGGDGGTSFQYYQGKQK